MTLYPHEWILSKLPLGCMIILSIVAVVVGLQALGYILQAFVIGTSPATPAQFCTYSQPSIEVNPLAISLIFNVVLGAVILWKLGDGDDVK